MAFTPSLDQRLVAHRGWQQRYPENTLIGIQAALNAGACHIEIDVHLTADHVPVLCHDLTLERLSGSSGTITELTLQQLQDYSAYEPDRLGGRYRGNPFTTLQQCVTLLQRYSGVSLYVEIKRKSLYHFGARKMLEAVLPLLQTLRDRSFLISFDVPVLASARLRGWKNIAPVLTTLEQARSEEFQRLQPDMLFCDTDLLSAAGAVQGLGWPVAVYEVDSAESAQYWFKQGVALVETFKVGQLINDLRAGDDG
ncbi:glycerophosphodiester phosphodiesterase family protein [Pseudomaricurvus sp. HS19]|uniref:glycerophosphodiester phosphodiesterase family protein n=1 Tax=Pseudomaricurvus sp. HS19 TaxID=2692626 RepID=UPI0013703424|nr:glycerophosphodiester phosphodiesterase family protein [Pseudomaricurvus sp. HS19]MYM64066.1 glycerophosphodiester phosphodiesterase [Pseudomaricurvus sp. HS19]